MIRLCKQIQEYLGQQSLLRHGLEWNKYYKTPNALLHRGHLMFQLTLLFELSYAENLQYARLSKAGQNRVLHESPSAQAFQIQQYESLYVPTQREKYRLRNNRYQQRKLLRSSCFSFSKQVKRAPF